MEILNIPNTPKTPQIKFDPTQGMLEIKGRSVPENSVEFYKPIIECLEMYAGSPKPVTQVDIQLEYFNSTTSKCIYQILKQLESINSKGHQVTVNWYYEEGDDDMLESIEDFQTEISLPFNLTKKELE